MKKIESGLVYLGVIVIGLVVFVMIVMSVSDKVYKVEKHDVKNGISYEAGTNIKLNGIVKSYYEPEELRSEWNDKIDTFRITYKSWSLVFEKHPKGDGTILYKSGVRSEENYKSGKLDGISKIYYESGKLGQKANFKEDKLNGISKIYYKSGRLEYEMNFKDGKTNGISKNYYESGILTSEDNFKDDKLDGIRKYYYESGALQFEANFKEDKLNGISKSYYESGILKSEDNFKDNKRDGISKNYYESGALLGEINAKNGKAISGVLYKENGKKERNMTNAYFTKLGLEY